LGALWCGLICCEEPRRNRELTAKNSINTFQIRAQNDRKQPAFVCLWYLWRFDSVDASFRARPIHSAACWGFLRSHSFVVEKKKKKLSISLRQDEHGMLYLSFNFRRPTFTALRTHLLSRMPPKSWRATSVECPQDRSSHRLPDGGVANLPRNYAIKDVIDRKSSDVPPVPAWMALWYRNICAFISNENSQRFLVGFVFLIFAFKFPVFAWSVLLSVGLIAFILEMSPYFAPFHLGILVCLWTLKYYFVFAIALTTLVGTLLKTCFPKLGLWLSTCLRIMPVFPGPQT